MESTKDIKFEQSENTLMKKESEKNPKKKNTKKANLIFLLKKTKSKFYSMIQRIVKSCLNRKVKNLPRDFISNITISYNQEYLNKTILEIYQEFDLLPEYKVIEEEGWIKSQSKEIFTRFITMKVHNIFKEYIESHNYIKDCRYIKEKFSKKISLAYDYIARNYVKYYIGGEEDNTDSNSKICINSSDKQGKNANVNKDLYIIIDKNNNSICDKKNNDIIINENNYNK